MKNKLEEFLRFNNVSSSDAYIITFEKSTHTSKEAADILGVDLSDIVKSILLVMENNYFLVLLPGNKKLRQRALRKEIKDQLGTTYKDSRLAKPEEVLNITGFEVGAVPPVGLDIRVILDSALIDKNIVYAGGGTKSSVLKISVKKILELTNPLVANIGREIEPN